MCMRIFAACNCAFLHVVNQTSITSPESSLHEKMFVNLTLRCQEHVEFAYYACVRNMAVVFSVCVGAEEAMCDPELL